MQLSREDFLPFARRNGTAETGGEVAAHGRLQLRSCYVLKYIQTSTPPPAGGTPKEMHIVVCHLPPKTLILIRNKTQTVETNLAKKRMRETNYLLDVSCVSTYMPSLLSLRFIC